MGVLVNKQRLFYLDEFDFSDHTTKIDWNHKNDAVDCTTWADGIRKYLPGLMDYTMNIEGFDDYASSQIDNEFEYRRVNAMESVITIVPEGTAIGSRCFMTKGYIENFNKTMEVADMAKFSVDIKNSATYPVTGGYLMEKENTISGSENGTGRQIGAITSGHVMYGTLHVLSGTFTSLATSIWSSTDGVTFGTQIGNFATRSTTGAEFRLISSAADTETYYRAQFTIGSGSCVVSIGLGIF